jgi:hypothetical protein
MADELGKMLDDLVGTEYAVLAFMVQLSVEIARSKPDPQAWARAFVSEMHERLNEHERSARKAGADEQINERTHELSRSRLDLLGQHLAQILARPK